MLQTREGSGPYRLAVLLAMGTRPYELVGDLSWHLDRTPHPDEGAEVRALVSGWLKAKVTAFEKAREELRFRIGVGSWQNAPWDGTVKNFYDTKGRLSTFDDALADYLRSLPPAFRGSISTPLLSAEEVSAASVEYDDLMKRAAAIIGTSVAAMLSQALVGLVELK